MTSSISRNLSHRRLVKQRTKQITDYLQYIPKTSKNLEAKVVDITNTISNQKQHETSINLQSSLDTSLSKRINGSNKSIAKHKPSSDQRSDYHTKNSYIRPRRQFQGKFKSVDIILKNRESPPAIKPSFSVKKIPKISATVSQQKITSMENLEIQQSLKKIQNFDYHIPKSQNDLKNTLKKTSAVKLKLKVKDPFERRSKLDFQFKDQSVIQKEQESFLSTVNQDEFRELLRKII